MKLALLSNFGTAREVQLSESKWLLYYCIIPLKIEANSSASSYMLVLSYLFLKYKEISA